MLPRRPSERGDTLLELLIAITLMGAVVVGIVGVLANDVAGAVRHRSRATALTLLEQGTEYVKAQGFQANCLKIADPPAPSPYTISVSSPEGMNPNGSTKPCVAAVNAVEKIQVVNVTVSGGVRGAPDSADVVLRHKP